MTAEPIASERLELVSMSADFMDAVLAGEHHVDGITVPEEWPDEHDARFLRLRRDQMRRDASAREWGVRAICLREAERPMIGHAGFHGKPGVNAAKNANAVEVGYTVFEPYRGRGYATEAVRALIRWAREQHGVTHFVASVSPENEPSLAIVRKLAFVQTGDQWDDEDGLELVFELKEPS